jgi:bifunctional ADP-heptose synthase (sugar kinase/adenylyltransferase)
MKEAALLANLAGLMAVLKFGTAQITRDELMKAISPTQGSQRRKR